MTQPLDDTDRQLLSLLQLQAQGRTGLGVGQPIVHWARGPHQLQVSADRLPVIRGPGRAGPARGPRSARQLHHSLQSAQAKPFAIWLRALGQPLDNTPRPLADWNNLAARNARQWQAEAGVSARRGEQLQAFFRHPEVLALRAELKAQEISGF